MSVKKVLAGAVRKIAPKRTLRVAEGTYRGARRRLTAAVYGFPNRGMKIIGVTGTNGKTTTVNMINEILKAAGLKTAMFSTAVIEIAGERKLNDLNLTVLPAGKLMQFFRAARKAQVDYVVLEVSSHALDQKKLDGLKYEVAVITNLTQDHLDYHITMGRYARAKGKMFAERPRFMVLNSDDEEWFKFFDRYEAGERKISYGHVAGSDVRIVDSKLYRRGTEAELKFMGDEFEVATEIPGEYNVGNMAAAAATGLVLGIGIEQVQDGIANLKGLPGRFQYVDFGDSPGVRPQFDVAVDYAGWIGKIIDERTANDR